ncbi:ATP-dependent Clp protease adaptor ClpS [Agrococcus baldri]|uniref:ATP-dependent Clp protease adapter protein ClpS n=1 Tax=Agrococcus baldri TaxID=153730 RepID=A0AA87US68_9MICO|nr:ATP-dependent Clp protease adaptor ClpS [Agrococcus baldri]GEK80354.1 ATP-dependent Clp protease adapter protein ClpS [Agrococcus baldri]
MTADTAEVPELTATSLGGDWATILWDDPVTLRPYVVRVLMRRFGYTASRADELTAQAEREGRAAVAHGSREEQEMHVAALHADGLVATLEKVPA